MGRKHCRKRRNCLLLAISPFPTVFSKDMYCRHVKTRACLGKGLSKMLYYFRAWEKWSLYTGNHSVYEEIVVPDVSRAMRLSYEGSGTDEDYLASLFNRKRLINM